MSTNNFLRVIKVAISAAAICSLAAHLQVALADAAAAESVLPKLKSTGSPAYYPDKAKRIGAEGRALLEFNISAAGRATGISIESSDGSTLLSDLAVTILKGDVFDLSEVAESADSRNTRYRMSFVFELAPCGRLQHYAVPKDAQTSICASRIHH
jgi:TonB family protein